MFSMGSRLLILLLWTFWGCSPQLPALKDMAGTPLFRLQWQPIDSLNYQLPTHVRVFYGVDLEVPLRAWYVHIQPKQGRLPMRVLAAQDPEDRRETASQLASRTEACVLLNAGYFTMNKKPADHVGLLMTDGQIQWPATGLIEQNKIPYYVSRAAMGITAEGNAELAWATSDSSMIYRWSRPLPNFIGHASSKPKPKKSQRWRVGQAIGAGPMVVWDGKTIYTAMDELFWRTSIPNIHPRSAVGIKSDGSVVLMLVDGRQTVSRGVSLTELGDLMRSVGATQAMNLDGGGSSTLVVKGQLLNRPVGGTTQREVVSAIGAWCQ
ncbi:MAG TPA: hypothetical protein DIW24_08600 [Bacteroidetes bacterium]|nr:hypothetical protein [Bacteroidota bacterium]HRR09841.1 phosphodiester glycosidase family protein [Rhodothermales bacterium]